MLSRRTPAWINDPEIRRAFRRKDVLKFPTVAEQKQTTATLSRFITLGVQTIYVPQYDGNDPPGEWVQASRLHPRDYPQQPTGDMLWHMLGEIKPVRPGEKFCVSCGDWRGVEKFSPKADSADGLHPYCKGCRADQARVWRMTAKVKEAA